MGQGTSGGGMGADASTASAWQNVDVGGGGAGGPYDSGGGSNGLMGILGSIMKNPQVLKEISNMGSKMAGATQAGQQMSPQTREMLTQAISHAQQRQQPQQQQNPFVGDMASLVTPDMARGVLSELGIPYGRMHGGL